MLKSLYIHSFVIIETLNIDFFGNMSALTGETGAGKSIIIDAIGQLCGNRSKAHLVQQGKEKAIIEGIFEIQTDLSNVFESYNIPYDEEILISKEIYANGRSQIKINQKTVTNNVLKEITSYLLHIHSQFETQYLFQEKNHKQLLDNYIKDELKPFKEKYFTYFHAYQELEKKIKKLTEEELSDERIEYYQKQYDLLKDLTYTDEDIENLENELHSLENYETIHEKFQNFEEIMDGNHGALDALQNALETLQSVSDIDEINEDYNHFYDLYYEINDVFTSIKRYVNNLDFDAYRFEELQNELYQIQKIQKQFGYSMQSIYKARDELKEMIDISLNREAILEKYQKEKDRMYQQAYEIASKIHQIRIDYSHKFEKKVKQELIDLYLPNANVEFKIEERKLMSDGFDDIKLLVSMNKGQAFSLLNESASGGEISRLMLAIKTLLLKDSLIETIIFDEVDTGVSGKVASSIGLKMQGLSQFKQIICITHLPQVCVYADEHFAIEKTDTNDHTYSHVSLLDENGRINEIAKMLSGDQISQEAKENAKQLLKLGEMK